MNSYDRDSVNGRVLCRHVFVMLAVTACSVLAVGCRRAYRIQFELQEPGDFRVGSPVVLDGLQVGEVEQVVVSPDRLIAEATLDRRLLKDRALKAGVKATEGAQGSIVLDSSHVPADAPELPSGATLVVQETGTDPVLAALQRYSALATLAAVALGLLVLCLTYLIFRKIIHVTIVIFCLVVAGLIAHRFSPYAEPLVVRAYAAIEQYEQARVTVDPSPGITSRLPKPKYTAFMVVLCASFAAEQALLGLFIRKPRRQGE